MDPNQTCPTCSFSLKNARDPITFLKYLNLDTVIYIQSAKGQKFEKKSFTSPKAKVYRRWMMLTRGPAIALTIKN